MLGIGCLFAGISAAYSSCAQGSLAHSKPGAFDVQHSAHFGAVVLESGPVPAQPVGMLQSHYFLPVPSCGHFDKHPPCTCCDPHIGNNLGSNNPCTLEYRP